nr:hypothetical protein CFP56_10392 [Quercus suber]
MADRWVRRRYVEDRLANWWSHRPASLMDGQRHSYDVERVSFPHYDEQGSCSLLSAGSSLDALRAAPKSQGGRMRSQLTLPDRLMASWLCSATHRALVTRLKSRFCGATSGFMGFSCDVPLRRSILYMVESDSAESEEHTLYITRLRERRSAQTDQPYKATTWSLVRSGQKRARDITVCEPRERVELEE